MQFEACIYAYRHPQMMIQKDCLASQKARDVDACDALATDHSYRSRNGEDVPEYGHTGIWTQGLPHAKQMWYHYTMCPWEEEVQEVILVSLPRAIFRRSLCQGCHRHKERMPRPGIEPGTFRSSVRRSPNWAIAAMLQIWSLVHYGSSLQAATRQRD